MKFVGGFRHGEEVPEESERNPRFRMYGFPEGTVECIRLWAPNSLGLVIYVKQQWFVAPDSPMIPFFGLVGMPIEELLELGREVLTPC